MCKKKIISIDGKMIKKIKKKSKYLIDVFFTSSMLFISSTNPFYPLPTTHLQFDLNRFIFYAVHVFSNETSFIMSLNNI